MARLRASLTVRVSADLRLALRDRARSEHTSVAAFCRRALRAELERGAAQRELPFGCAHERTYRYAGRDVCVECKEAVPTAA